MKIIICGSLSFAREILETKKKVLKLGHEVEIPANTEKYADGSINVENKWERVQLDVIKRYFEIIKEGDVILIINKTKNNIENYIGGNGLIEMAFAHFLNKKIFLLNPIPKINYTDEIEAMNPTILNGDLNLIR